MFPTYTPTYNPTYSPTMFPTYTPTYIPTFGPTYLPTYEPTYSPTYSPTYLPSHENATVNNFSSNIFKANGSKMYLIILCIVPISGIIIYIIYKYYTKKETNKNEFELDTIYNEKSEEETTDKNSFIINPLVNDTTPRDFYRRSIDL